MLRRLRRLAKQAGDDQKAADLTSMVFEGSSHRWTLHETAHGDRVARTLMPGPETLDRWHVLAALAANELTAVDREWCEAHWGKGRTPGGRTTDPPRPGRGGLPGTGGRTRHWHLGGDWMHLVFGIDEDGWWPMEWPW